MKFTLYQLTAWQRIGAVALLLWLQLHFCLLKLCTACSVQSAAAPAPPPKKTKVIQCPKSCDPGKGTCEGQKFSASTMSVGAYTTSSLGTPVSPELQSMAVCAHAGIPHPHLSTNPSSICTQEQLQLFSGMQGQQLQCVACKYLLHLH